MAVDFDLSSLSEDYLTDDDIKRRRRFAQLLKQQAITNDLGPAGKLGVGVKGFLGLLGGMQEGWAKNDDLKNQAQAGNDIFNAAKSNWAASQPPAPAPTAPAYDAAQPGPTSAPFDPATAKTYNPAADASTGEMFDTANVTPTKAPLSPTDRDYAVRTLYGEANRQSPEGQAAVAHVLFNRLNSGQHGKSLQEVVLEPHQFEPWATRRKELTSLSPRSPGYQSLGNVVDTAWQGLTPDPTNGAVNFLNKDAQVARGMPIPDWAQGEGQKIGDHTFYGGTQVAQADQASPTGNTLSDEGTEATPPAPTGPTKEQEDIAKRLLSRESTRAMGVAYLKLIYKDQTEEKLKQLAIEEKEADIAKTKSETNKKKAPEVREFYDDQGRSVKKTWNEDTGQWEQQGAAKTSQANMNPTTQKAMLNADSMVQTSNAALTSLQHAIAINDKSYTGPGARERGYVTSLFGSDAGEATEDLNNTVMNNALAQLKTIFGGNPTEGERAILIEVQGAVNQAAPVRKNIFEKAIKIVEARRKLYATQSKGLRDGTYYTPEGEPDQPAPISETPPEALSAEDRELWPHMSEDDRRKVLEHYGIGQ